VTVRAADIPFDSNKKPTPQERIFRVRGENEYSLEVLPAGITFYVSRLRRDSQGLHGELSVTLTNGHFAHAHTIGKGVLSAADMNFSAQNTRVQRGKHLKERCGSDGDDFDWIGFVEELSVNIIDAERRGDPSVVLSDIPKNPDKQQRHVWMIKDFPVLQRHPTVLFGKGGCGKSMFAMWIAGHLAGMGIPVGYLDWELSGEDHQERLEQLFQPAPKLVHYLYCRHPLRDQTDRIRRLVEERHCQYLVFDSVGPASRQGGHYQDGDPGQEYFGLVRQFGLGSLHVAHPPKHVADEKDATIYGSAFFGYLARSMWFIEGVEQPGKVVMGFYHQKHTTGAKLAPRAYQLIFRNDRVFVESTDLSTVDELAAKLPIVDRMRRELSDGAKSIKDLALALDVPQPTIRKTVSRHPSTFRRLDARTVILTGGTDEF
jgi:hypothetical protein